MEQVGYQAGLSGVSGLFSGQQSGIQTGYQQGQGQQSRSYAYGAQGPTQTSQQAGTSSYQSSIYSTPI